MVADLIYALIGVVVVGGGTAAVIPLVRSRRQHPGGNEPGPEPGGATAVGTLERDEAPAGAAAPEDVVVAPAPSTVIEKPPPSAGRLTRLRSRLARSHTAIGSVLLNLISAGKLDEQAWEEMEDTLITADMGVGPARQLTDQLRTEVKVVGTNDPQEVRGLLRAGLIGMLGPDMDRSLQLGRHGDRPSVVLIVGVNGTGKTTTCGKLARVLIGDGKTVVLGAADTFRAAAADQLQTWGERVGAEVVRSDREGADPASVAFTAVNEGIERGVEKHGTVDEVLLVLDATTGQNGLRQARVFAEVTDVTGIILTKLDGTAKGGI